MKFPKTALIYGFFVWLIPFIIAFSIFTIRNEDRPLFESIMPVVVTIVTIVFANFYFKKVDKDFIKEGIVIGLLWLVISIVLDLILFMEGPMKMSFVDYIKDIGLTYLIIPTILIGFCYFIKNR